MQWPLPPPFLTAYYVEVARIRPQETVLIHSAAGGTGQGMRSDRTALRRRNLRHRKALTRREYYCAKRTGSPTIASSTADPRPSRPGIGAMTKGRDVDIVIDSLAGEALRSTWEECLASQGRFMYRDWQERHHVSLGQLPMATFAKNVTFASVDLMAAFARNTGLFSPGWYSCG